MSANWKEILRNIDTKTDFLVNGYIRECETLLQKNDATIIPSLVIYTVLMYY